MVAFARQYDASRNRTNDGSDVLWGLGDHEGTIRDIVNNSGEVQDHRTYDSFGNVTDETAPATDFIFGYTGKAWDEDVGLYDYWHRWYDPAVGRFASEDPTVPRPDQNLYRYVGNNPLNNTDPSGLRKIKTTGDSYLFPSAYAVPKAATIGTELLPLTYSGTTNVSSGTKSITVSSGIVGPTSQAAPANGSLRSQLFSSIDNWSVNTGYTALDVPGTFVANIVGNAIAKPAVWLGTNWRADTQEERVNTILTRQVVVNQSTDMGTPTALLNLYASSTTDQIAFGAVGFDPMTNRSLGASERIQRIAGGTAAYTSTWIPVASAIRPVGVTVAPSAVQQLGRGSTANLSKGTTLARNLREQLAIEQTLSKPTVGGQLPLKIADPRWPASQGWVKQQQIIQSGGREGPINVHYLYNTVTSAVDDAKIVLPGVR